MQSKNSHQINAMEPSSYLWHELFVEIRVPVEGVVIEVAPGYEPKIGNALSALGFRGTIFLIEPDQNAACHIKEAYQQILPRATVKIITKLLQKVEVGADIPRAADALVASHPFDDMVMACMVGRANFFSQEKEEGMNMPAALKKIYDTVEEKDYTHGIKTTVAIWKRFIKKSKPNYFIASQYPSRTLMVKGLWRRQNSGFIVLEQLKKIYKNSLLAQDRKHQLGYKGDPKWWIVAQKPSLDSDDHIMSQPLVIKRLGKSIFVPQRARLLRPEEYDIVYFEKNHFGNLRDDAILKQIRSLAIVLENERSFSPKTIVTYADRQKDSTGIGLNGNHGSGRAVYYGDRFNILGVGRTTLCKSTVPSHSTGRLELIGAMRRIILSRWINYFTKRAPAHSALIALKEAAKFKWNSRPVPLCLLVREDDGSLDRPSHVEQSPQISVHFEKTLREYAKLDAEYFAYRMMLGAWSTSNYSLGGHMIDLESASFVRYRGPYYTSSPTYPHNRFGYEGLGFLKILHQLAKIRRIRDPKIESRFYRARQKYLGRCFLLLLGIDDRLASSFFSRYQDRVVHVSDQFERLSKKINSQTARLGLYAPIPDDQDPSLLDVSHLLRNLVKLYQSPNRETKAFGYLVRKTSFPHIKPSIMNTPLTPWGEFLQRVVITHDRVDSFLSETRYFIHTLFQLLVLLDSEKCLYEKDDWDYRLHTMNCNLPTMYKLNTILRSFAESYRRGAISAKALGEKIRTLCELPNRQ